MGTIGPLGGLLLPFLLIWCLLVLLIRCIWQPRRISTRISVQYPSYVGCAPEYAARRQVLGALLVAEAVSDGITYHVSAKIRYPPGRFWPSTAYIPLTVVAMVQQSTKEGGGEGAIYTPP